MSNQPHPNKSLLLKRSQHCLMGKMMSTVQRSNRKSNNLLKNSNTPKRFNKFSKLKNLFTMIPPERSNSHSTPLHLRAKLKKRMWIGRVSIWSQTLFNCVIRSLKPCIVISSCSTRRELPSLLFTLQVMGLNLLLRSLATI